MSSYDNKRYHSRDGDYRDRDRDYRRDRDERDRRRRDSSSDNPPADPIKKALEGFSIPKKSVSDSVNETSPPKKSLSESINNRLLNLSSTPPSSGDDKATMRVIFDNVRNRKQFLNSSIIYFYLFI